MTIKDQTQNEKRAAADAAKKSATDARAAANAQPDDAALKAAAEKAEADAAALETEANAPSHEPKPGYKGPGSTTSDREKAEKRAEILLADINKKRVAEGLRPLSISEFKDDEGESDDEGATPVTHKDLRDLGIVKTAEQMVGEIADAELRQAVSGELAFVAKDLTPQQRFDKAMALASSSKNARIAMEARRITVGPRPYASGQGSVPAREEDGEFVPTPQEATYMNKYGLTKEQIIQSRKDALAGNFGQTK
jgi:hypothetical protein